MTERLYHERPEATEAELAVVRVVDDATAAGAAWNHARRPAVVLDRTIFFPTGGGQPHDTGRLGDAAVLDVIALESGEVLHVLERLPDGCEPGARLPAALDVGRRRDHAQQHSGQHLLSRAFVRECGAPTVSFHLGAAECSIDLDRDDIDEEAARRVERAANEVVQEDRAVTVRVVGPDEVEALLAAGDGASAEELRKPPPEVVLASGRIRLVTIEGWDVSPCCGTHVRRTGELGLIKLTGLERTRGRTRARFLVGRRAIEDYGRALRALGEAASFLSVGRDQLTDQVRKLREDLRASERERRRLEEALLPTLATAWLDAAAPLESGRWQRATVVTGRIDWGDGKTLGALAERVLAEGKQRDLGLCVALLGQDDGGGRVSVLFARTRGEGPDMADLVTTAARTLGGRGGGKPDRAQGVGTKRAALEQVLEAARAEIARA